MTTASILSPISFSHLHSYYTHRLTPPHYISSCISVCRPLEGLRKFPSSPTLCKVPILPDITSWRITCTHHTGLLTSFKRHRKAPETRPFLHRNSEEDDRAFEDDELRSGKLFSSALLWTIDLFLRSSTTLLHSPISFPEGPGSCGSGKGVW